MTATRLEERRRRALAQRYLGAALIGLAIVLYWLARLAAARWGG